MRNVAEGRGFSADELHSAQLDAMRAKVLHERPELLELGRNALAAHIRSERDMETLRVELHRAYGADGVRMALDLLRREAEDTIRLADLAAQQKRELDAIAKAQAAKDAERQAAADARAKADADARAATQSAQPKPVATNHNQTRR